MLPYHMSYPYSYNIWKEGNRKVSTQLWKLRENIKQTTPHLEYSLSVYLPTKNCVHTLK